jgi:glycosyltransferase involved in cell wall biosynthesis
MSQPVLSVVVPVYNEAANIQPLFDALQPIVKNISEGKYEIIFVDDGSTDTTAEKIAGLRDAGKQIKLLNFSRNFGKEIALAAGIGAAAGDAIITLDGDGQHPVDRIPDFIAAWKAGAHVVVGVRKANKNEGVVKKYGSKLFYSTLNRLMGVRMVPGSSDFRLIDREVQREFVKLQESNAMTRGLIDWLGFKPVYIEYSANARVAEAAGYKFRQLFKLAANSFVSLSPTPLYAFGYLGLFITGTSLLLGLSILIEQVLLGDPLSWNFTGTAMLSVLVLFLVGLVLVSQGVLALYISAIHTQTKRRPLYIINKRASLGISNDD